MLPDRELEERVASLAPITWSGAVFRVAPYDSGPLVASLRAARWNREGMRTLYASLEAETAIAEVRYHVLRQRPHRVKTHALTRMQVDLRAALDLRDPEAASLLELPRAIGDEYAWAQRIGAAAVLLRHDGLIVPSSRAEQGTNVVIYMDRLQAEADIAVVETMPVDLRLPLPDEESVDARGEVEI